MKFINRKMLRAIIWSQCYKTLNQLRDKQNQRKNANYSNKNKLLGVTVIGILGYHFFINKKQERYAFAAEKFCNRGLWKKGLPTYSMKEVKKHNTTQKRIWVTYHAGVYDITDYIQEHPGGDQILLAAGSHLEAFYTTYGFHEVDHVTKRLEDFRIGNLSKQDRITKNYYADPFEDDPTRDPMMEIVCTKPYCASLKLRYLTDSFYTPNNYFYVRNHLPVPNLNPETYEFVLEVENTDKCLKFTLDEIKKLPKTTINCTLMCSGNRRSEMMEMVGRKTAVHWGPTAINNAQWTGVKLRDLLTMVDVTEGDTDYTHVQFEGWDFETNAIQYGGSIPISKALSEYGDVLVAYEMNGLPLPPDHGFPLRLIIPGYAGERNVKWLVSNSESPAHPQQLDNKSFPPSTTWENADYKTAPSIQGLPVISAICRPVEGEEVLVSDGCIDVRGYAYSGGGQKIVNVDVTIDGGETWLPANLDHQDDALPPRHWCWTLWSAKIPIDSDLKSVEIWCKALDSSCNTQPETFENIYNFKGVLCNAYHRVKVKLKQ